MHKRCFVFLLIATLFWVGCGSGTEKTDDFISEESLGLRTTDLYSEDNTKGDAGSFNAAPPGQSQVYERSFENAPPLIPHSTTGFLPIKAGQNMCLTCHMPDVAPKTKSTPIPKSHFMNFRPDIVEKDGMVKIYEDDEHGNSITHEDLGNQLSNARYNCSQCHVPQAYTTVILKNNFKADFRNEDLKKKSNFAEVMEEGVK